MNWARITYIYDYSSNYIGALAYGLESITSDLSKGQRFICEVRFIMVLAFFLDNDKDNEGVIFKWVIGRVLKSSLGMLTCYINFAFICIQF